jgi:hypothetical protein
MAADHIDLSVESERTRMIRKPHQVTSSGTAQRVRLSGVLSGAN